MKAVVFLLLLAAFCSCGLAQVEDSALEELQVETLVSNITVIPPQQQHDRCGTKYFYSGLLGEARNLLCALQNGRYASNPLHSK